MEIRLKNIIFQKISTFIIEVVYNPSYEMLFEEETKKDLEGYEKGQVTGLEQFTKNNFKYSNAKNPEIYIDVEFKYDSYDRLVEELHFDENHKMIRHYTAEYEGDNISKIWVEDCLNGATWQIVPIKVRTGNEPSFAIRY